MRFDSRVRAPVLQALLRCTSRRVAPRCHAASCHVLSHHVVSHHVVSNQVVSHRVVSDRLATSDALRSRHRHIIRRTADRVLEWVLIGRGRSWSLRWVARSLSDRKKMGGSCPCAFRATAINSQTHSQTPVALRSHSCTACDERCTSGSDADCALSAIVLRTAVRAVVASHDGVRNV